MNFNFNFIKKIFSNQVQSIKKSKDDTLSGDKPYVIVSQNIGGIKNPQSDYKSLLTASQCHHIYTAIDTVVKTIQKKQVVFFEKDKTIPMDKVLKIPDKYYSFTDLLGLIVMSLEATGNAYIYRDLDDTLYFLDPSQVKIITSDTEPIVGYNINMRNYPRENIFHIKYINIQDPYGYGISPFLASINFYNKYEYLTEYENNMMENLGVPPVILKWGKTTEQAKKLLELWIEAYSGYRNAGKTGVIPEDANIIRSAFTPAEMNFIDIRKFTREEIYQIFRVPMILTGITEQVNRANIWGAQVIFENSKIIPICSIIQDAFNTKLFSNKYQMKFLHTPINDIEAEISMNRMLLDEKIVSANEIRLKYGYPEVKDGSWIYRTLSEIPTVNTDIKKEKTEKTLTGERGDNFLIKKDFENIGLNMWKSFIYWQGRLEKKMIEAFGEYSKWLGGKMKKQLLSLTQKKGETPTPSPIDFFDLILIDPALIETELKMRLEKYITEAIYQTLGQKRIELGIELSESNIQTFLSKYIENLEGTWKGIVSTDIKQLKKLFNQGIEENLSMQKIAKLIYDKYNPTSGDYINRTRAFTIARTETARASNQTTHYELEEVNFTYHRWFTALDERVRENHKTAHGQIQRLSEPFLVGGERLAYPGDPTASPSNVINCRCVEIPEKNEI